MKLKRSCTKHRTYPYRNEEPSRQKKTAEERLEDARQQLVQAKEEVQKPFEKEEELKFIQARLVKVNAELDVGSDEEKIQKDGKNRQEEQRICL